ncbi:hypothetical protein DHD05_20355 [Arenibacter sp. N53]|uniref:DUF6090 family protein n=1 Tax=Arenibacter TaxID=178469 RepID=UPI000CD3EFB7|nr:MULTISPECIES: DUF6090 family protein [Arenibacter]MCM4153949.1 hypothetical protein [Arenibacter sp. N53]
MIKFFRKIRKRLLTENKFSKYFLYAIGEIILVVLGILIALNVNNNNSEKKDRVLEIKILKEIGSNLQIDLQELRDDISHMDSLNRSCNNIINFIKTETIPKKEFYLNAAMLRVSPHFDPNKSGYSLLVSKGADIILNDSLRKSISVLYETNYVYYFRYEEERIQFRANNIAPKLQEYFTMLIRPDLTYKGEFQISQEDYSQLKKDKSFVKLMTTTIFENSLVLVRAKRIEKNILELSSQLLNEIDK